MKKIKVLRTVVIYSVFASVILALLLIRYFSNKYSDVYSSYAVAQSKRIVTLIINKSMSKNMFNNLGRDDLLRIKRNNKGEILDIDIDIYRESVILDAVTEKIEKNLTAVSKGDISNLDIELSHISDIDYENIKNGIVYSVPMGSLIGGGFLSNVGPSIPVKIILIGDVISELDSKVFNYGINNAMIEIDVKVNVTFLVSFIFISKEIKVSSSRPIIMQIIQGDIPNYYFDNFVNN